MVCKDKLPLIHQYFDGDFTIAESSILKAHLHVCNHCRNYFEQLERTEAVIRSMMPAPFRTSDDFADRVMNKLPAKSRWRTVYRWVKRHPAVSVAAVFMVVMLFSFLTLWNEDPQVMVKGSGIEQVVIQGKTVYVPAGGTVHGDLIVKGGELQVDGQVEGNIILIDGKLNMASAANISGKISYVNQAMDWLWFKIQEIYSLFSK